MHLSPHSRPLPGRRVLAFIAATGLAAWAGAAATEHCAAAESGPGDLREEMLSEAEEPLLSLLQRDVSLRHKGDRTFGTASRASANPTPANSEHVPMTFAEMASSSASIFSEYLNHVSNGSLAIMRVFEKQELSRVNEVVLGSVYSEVTPVEVGHALGIGVIFSALLAWFYYTFCVAKDKSTFLEDKAKLLAEQASNSLPQDTVVSLFKERVRGHSVCTALERSDGASISYRELSSMADGLAARICSAGFGGAGTVIATILPEGTADVPVAALGILVSGAVWLPLSQSQPRGELAASLAAAGAQLVLAGRHGHEAALDAAANASYAAGPKRKLDAAAATGHCPPGCHKNEADDGEQLLVPQGSPPRHDPPVEPRVDGDGRGASVWLLWDEDYSWWAQLGGEFERPRLRKRDPAVACCTSTESQDCQARCVVEVMDHEQVLSQAWHLVREKQLQVGTRTPLASSAAGAACELFGVLTSGGTLLMAASEADAPQPHTGR